MSINSLLPHLGRGNITRAEAVPIDKPLKPGLHFLLHCHLVRRKRTRLGIVGESRSIKMRLGPIFWVQNPTKERTLSGKGNKKKLPPRVRGFTNKTYPKKCPNLEQMG